MCVLLPDAHEAVEALCRTGQVLARVTAPRDELLVGLRVLRGVRARAREHEVRGEYARLVAARRAAQQQPLGEGRESTEQRPALELDARVELRHLREVVDDAVVVVRLHEGLRDLREIADESLAQELARRIVGRELVVGAAALAEGLGRHARRDPARGACRVAAPRRDAATGDERRYGEECQREEERYALCGRCARHPRAT